MTVNRRRSASRALRTIARGAIGKDGAVDSSRWEEEGRACSLNGCPHLPQNLKWGGFSAPQLGHRLISDVPHSPQNFIPPGFSNPQLAQRMLPLYPFGLPRARKRLAA